MPERWVRQMVRGLAKLRRTCGAPGCVLLPVTGRRLVAPNPPFGAPETAAPDQAFTALPLVANAVGASGEACSA